MTIRARLLSLVIFTAFASHALAYSDDGHMYVAKIAYDRLSPAKRQKLDAIMAKLRRGGVQYNAVTAACWPDDVKHTTTYEHTAPWHYIDTPLNGGQPPHGANILDGINNSIAAYNKATAQNDQLGQAKALAFLIHLTGDIHQPLHCAEPGHSTGGNGIAISNASPKSNLHHFWDGAYGATFTNGKVRVASNAGRPSSPNDASFANRTKAVMNGHTPMFGAGGLNYQAWANKSFTIAKDNAYGPLNIQGPPYHPVTVSKTYVDKARDITDRQVVIAGYRLATLLNSLLP